MPKRKKSFKRRRRKGVRRRLVRSKLRTNRGLILGGFPKSKIVKLRYVTQIALNAPSVGNNAVHVFRANSMYDPDFTGTGHQPSNFDRWTNVYDHYTVVGSKINVRYAPTAVASVIPAYVGIALTDSGSETATISPVNLFEKKLVRTRWRSIGINENGHGFIGLRHKFSARKFFGKPKGSLVNDSLYRGRMGNLGTGSDPSEGAFYEVFATQIGANDPGDLHFIVTIDYIAVLTEPKMDDES